MATHCNIDKTDRICRSLIGLLLIIAAYYQMSYQFFMILGGVLLIQGFIGWCSIPFLLSKLSKKVST